MESEIPKEPRQARKGAGKSPKEREYPKMKAQMRCKKKLKREKRKNRNIFSILYQAVPLFKLSTPSQTLPKVPAGADPRAGSALPPALSLLQSSSPTSTTEC